MCDSEGDAPGPGDNRGEGGGRIRGSSVVCEDSLGEDHSAARASLEYYDDAPGGFMHTIWESLESESLLSPALVEGSVHGVGNSEGGSGFWSSVFNGTNVLMGVGLLSLPYTLRLSGWVGLLLLTLVAAITSS